MTLLEQMQEIETAKNNIKHSLELKGKNPNDDIRTYSAIINSMDGDVPSSMRTKIIIQEDEPDETVPYEGIWIKSADYTYDNVYIINSRDEIQAGVNIIKGSVKNPHKTVLLDSDIVGGLYISFYEVVISNADNEILWDIPIYYGYDNQWINITPKDVHWAGVTVDFINQTITRIADSDDIDSLYCYNHRIRCNLDNDGNVIARYGDGNYDNMGNENLQVMVEQPIVYVKVDNVELQSDGRSLKKCNYYIADGPMEGYSIHWAFNVDGDIYKNIYLNAFEGTIVNNKLCSYNNGQTAYNSGTISNALTYAANRGSIWRMMTKLVYDLECLLLLIEYQAFNLTSVLAYGKTTPSIVGLVDTTRFDENGTGYQNGNKSADLSFTYRYRENPYGSQQLFVTGYGTDGNAQYICNSHFNINTPTETTYYIKVLPHKFGDGSVKSFEYIPKYPYLFLHSTSGGSSDTFINSYHNRYSNEVGYSTYRNGSRGLYGMECSPVRVGNINTCSYTGTCLLCYPSQQIVQE